MLRLKTQVRSVGAVALAGLLAGLVLLLRAEAEPLLAISRSADELEPLIQLDALAHELQRERGVSQLVLAGIAPAGRLLLQQTYTDRVLAQSDARDRGLVGGEALADERRQVAAGTTDAARCHAAYGRLIAPLLRRPADLSREHGAAALRAPLMAHAALAGAKEQLAQLRAVGLRAGLEYRDDLPPGVPTLQQLAVFDAALAATLEAADAALAAELHALMGSAAAQALRAQALALGGQRERPGTLTALRWYDTASTLVDALRAQQEASVARMRARARDELASAAQGLAWRALLVALAWLGACWLVYAALRRLLTTIRRLDAEARALFGRVPGATAEAPGDGEASFMRLVEHVDALGRQARTDALTGAINRHGLHQLFDVERGRAQRNGRSIGVVVADIDHFKPVNDRYGHAAGDAVLREVARLLRRQVRAGDIVARWGGEEFVVVAPESDIGAAVALAEKLRTAVAGHAFGQPPRLTASFGVAVATGGESLEAVVARADAALYRAKAGGRDCVEPAMHLRAAAPEAAARDATAFATAA